MPDDDQIDTHPPRRGRPRVQRRISEDNTLRCFSPQCRIKGEEETVMLLPEEIELLRLVDLEGMQQEEAASVLGISRRTVWRDLHEARRKIAEALIYGKGIRVSDCTLRTEGLCPKEDEDICPREGESCPKRWQKITRSGDTPSP
jgi:predicted DNA-binding protein (UPF0251 family)